MSYFMKLVISNVKQRKRNEIITFLILNISLTVSHAIKTLNIKIILRDRPPMQPRN